MSKFLFSVIPTNDFGCLTRSLPIARELKLRGHEVAFCHPAKGPQIVIAEEGFQNLLADDPLYYLLPDPTIKGSSAVPWKRETVTHSEGYGRSYAKGRANKASPKEKIPTISMLNDFFLLNNEDFTRCQHYRLHQNDKFLQGRRDR